jgi:peptidoglycan/LPS O-acetylase OafA/YrhL
MRAALAIVSLVFLGGSLLPGGSTEVSIAFVVAAMAIAASAVVIYIIEEYRRQQPSRRSDDRRRSSSSWLRRANRSVHS